MTQGKMYRFEQVAAVFYLGTGRFGGLEHISIHFCQWVLTIALPGADNG